MKTKPRSHGKRRPYGPNIVRAWFDTVFQYALRGLESERSFLTRRNWTFRFLDRSLEYLRPLREHLPGGARENLEQLISFFPLVSAKITDHDACQHQIEESCCAYLTAILQDADFRQAFEGVKSEAPHSLGREFNSYFGAYSSDIDSMGILAEYVINNVESLPSYYSTAELWNRYRDRFLPVVAAPGLASYRQMAEQSGHAMLEAVDELTALLKALRGELSLQFDVPFVAELSSAR